MLDFLGEEIKNVISFDLLGLTELRLRQDKPLTACYVGGCERSFDRMITREDLETIMLRLTKHSVYLFAESMKNGYITADDGERVGICGRCVIENGSVKMIKDVSSLCVRIPKEVIGFSDSLLEKYRKEGLSSTLVISPPGFGKTTFLRDIARNVSVSLKKNVLITDEKNEIWSPKFSFGTHCDAILSANKSFAFSEGVRNLRPEVIISDELSSLSDASGALNAVFCGVTVIASAHAPSVEYLEKKPDLKILFDNKVFKTAVVIEKNYSLKIFDL